MTSQMASCDVYRCASIFYFRCFQTLNLIYCLEQWFVIDRILTHVVLWTRLRVSFDAYVDPLYDFQVIYRVSVRKVVPTLTSDER
jgi:hypothetical protein